MTEITRIPGNVPSRCWGSAYRDFAWVLGMSDDFDLDFRMCDDVGGYFIHLSLADIADPEIRQRLQSIRTGLTLDDEDIDLLVDAGYDLTVSNADLKSLREDYR